MQWKEAREGDNINDNLAVRPRRKEWQRMLRVFVWWRARGFTPLRWNYSLGSAFVIEIPTTSSVGLNARELTEHMITRPSSTCQPLTAPTFLIHNIKLKIILTSFECLWFFPLCWFRFSIICLGGNETSPALALKSPITTHISLLLTPSFTVCICS